MGKYGTPNIILKKNENLAFEIREENGIMKYFNSNVNFEEYISF